MQEQSAYNSQNFNAGDQSMLSRVNPIFMTQAVNNTKYQVNKTFLQDMKRKMCQIAYSRPKS